MFDGSVWTQIASNVGSVGTMEIYNNELYVAGTFSLMESVTASNIAKWDGQNWSPVGAGISNTSGVSTFVKCLYNYNGELYVGGGFNTAGGISANNIAKWDGVNWLPLSTGLSLAGGGVMCMAEFNCELMIGGSISGTKRTTVNRVAEFNGK